MACQNHLSFTRYFLPSLRLWLVLLAGLLTLSPPLPARAGLTPGAQDTGFNPGDGASSWVNDIALQPDGKVLIVGTFVTLDAVGRSRIARLNADGSLDASFDPGSGANGDVDAVALQPDGKVLILGNFTTFQGVTRSRVARLNADGSLDATFNPGAVVGNWMCDLAVQPDGKVLIAGYFTEVGGVTRNNIARLNADGSLDTSFAPNAGPNPFVKGMTLQPDGKLLIVGNFSQVDGVERNGVARLNADGSLDASFDPGAGVDAPVWAVAAQPDGKILIAGQFTHFDGVGRNRLARLDADGALDAGFDPGAGANDMIRAVALQADGKVLIAGDFDQVAGAWHYHIACLNADGSLDTSFDTYTWIVGTLALQPDGKILIGGDFTEVDGLPCSRIARLNADGSVDSAFNPATGADGLVYALALQPNAKALIGGDFETFHGMARSGIVRLDANGSVDASFNPGTGASGGAVYAVIRQPDGKILIGGFFTQFNDIPRGRIARLNANGSLDSSFDPGTGASGSVRTIALQPDGKVLIGGGFTQVNGVARDCLARLNADGSLDTAFNVDFGLGSLVLDMALQPDGKVLIGGFFAQVDGVTRNHIARLNADGSFDASFDPGVGANQLVLAVARQPDGKVVIGGNFTQFAGIGRNRIARLNADGSLDTGFDPGVGANGTVRDIVFQADGKLLVGGDFTLFNEVARNRIARLAADGILDTGFDAGTGVNAAVYAALSQPDGKVLIGGDFSMLNGTRVARLNGATPPAFTSAAPPADGRVGMPYGHTFRAGGLPPPTFQVIAGSLPPGMHLDVISGVLTGALTSGGVYTFTVMAANYAGLPAMQDVSLMIAKGDTTTTITTHAPDPSSVGQPITVTYTVTAGTGMPTGNVIVGDGTANCSGTVAAGSCMLSFNSAGTKTLIATYAGDTSFNGSTSAGVVQTVQAAGWRLFLPLVLRQNP